MSGDGIYKATSIAPVYATESSGEISSPTSDGSVSLLESVLWKKLVDAENFDELSRVWLALQCKIIGNVRCGAFVVIGSDGERNGVAVWPDRLTDVSCLSPTVESVLSRKRGIVQRIESTETPENDKDGAKSPESTRIGFPVETQHSIVGVVALRICTVDADALRTAMRDLQWGVVWLREFLTREQNETYRRSANRTSAALEALAVALEQERFVDACRAVVTEVALNSRCERVSIGFRQRGSCRVKSISNSADFGKRMNLVRILGAAMDEAIDQRAVISYPPASGSLHTFREHEKLARLYASTCILTVPMFVYDRFIGALLCERQCDEPFSNSEVEYVENVTAIIGPIVVEKRQNDQWLVVKAKDAIVRQFRMFLGPGYFKRKLAAIVLGVTAATGYFATSDYHVTADAVVEGRIQRTIVAPFDGFVKSAEVRAGDEVEAGEFLVSLDDRSFSLERLRWITELQKGQYEYERALGERNRVESRIAKARIKHADAWVRLMEQQISRTRMSAPFDGVIVGGDLSQSIGGAVQRGDVLFEVAPLDSYRVILKVDESQIRDIDNGSSGQLRLTAHPNESYSVAVRMITPIAIAEEGRNFIQVEGDLEGNIEGLRPGMSGVCHIEVGQRRLIWIWTRGFVDWLRLFLWRWWS